MARTKQTAPKLTLKKRSENNYPFINGFVVNKANTDINWIWAYNEEMNWFSWILVDQEWNTKMNFIILDVIHDLNNMKIIRKIELKENIIDDIDIDIDVDNENENINDDIDIDIDVDNENNNENDNDMKMNDQNENENNNENENDNDIDIDNVNENNNDNSNENENKNNNSFHPQEIYYSSTYVNPLPRRIFNFNNNENNNNLNMLMDFDYELNFNNNDNNSNFIDDMTEIRSLNENQNDNNEDAFTYIKISEDIQISIESFKAQMIKNNDDFCALIDCNDEIWIFSKQQDWRKQDWRKQLTNLKKRIGVNNKDIMLGLYLFLDRINLINFF